MSSDPATGSVFISYRRDDSAYPSQSIYDSLVSRFGEEAVFFDVDSIPMGMDFHGVLNDAVAKCDLLLAVIGDHWLNARDEAGARRLENPDDFVRIEIEAALSRQIPVVPVLVGSATVPRPQDLPQTLAGLSRRQATEVRPGRSFHGDLERLVQGVELVFERMTRKPVATDQPSTEQSLSGVPIKSISPAATDAARPLETMTNSIGMQLALIPAGEFMMGSSHNKDQHKVRITKPFYLGAYAVTQAEYEEVMGVNPSRFQGATNPVEMVSWDDATEFCKRLSAREGETYRLPTEAEWEYACRAGTTTQYSFGDDAQSLRGYAWYIYGSNRKTHPVGEKKANAWGLYDMHGNVWEWCQDWYDRGYYRDSPTDDPQGPSSAATRRVVRGGGWWDEAWSCRAAFRFRGEPKYRDDNLGFRVVRSSAQRAK